MFCKHCGAQIDSAVLYCPRCGKDVRPDPNVPAAEKKGYPFWFKILMLVGLLGIVVGLWDSYRTENPVTVIEGQLDALRENKITEAYYGYTSKDFQEATSLDIFREFVKTYPAFIQNRSFTLSKKELGGSQGLVEGALISKEGGEVPVQYRLVKDGDKWKILSIQLVKAEKGDVHVDEPVKESMKAPIEAQLKALREHDIHKAYEGLVSQDFEKETPLKDFEAFVRQYPFLTSFEGHEYGDFASNNERGDVTVILETSLGKMPVEYKLLKEKGKWKIWSLKVILPDSQKEIKDNPIAAPVKEVLNTLKEGNYKKAYEEFTTADFRKISSFNDFADFVAKYPALATFNKVDYQLPEMKNDNAVMKAEVISDQGITIVEFVLAQENQRWKIQGLQVLQKAANNANVETDKFDHAPLQKVIEDQLASIRNKQIAQGYQDYTSEDFKKATSLEDFKIFAEGQPALRDNKKVAFDQLKFNNNIATYSTILTSNDGKDYSVDYDLIPENGMWKILHIQVSVTPRSVENGAEKESADSKVQGSLEFTNIELGNSIDLEGKIIDPKTTLQRSAGDIYVNVHVSNGNKGTRLELIFEHVESNSRIPPVATTLPQNGESMVSFVFSPPTGGWPKGNYRILATASTGEEKTIEFKVE